MNAVFLRLSLDFPEFLRFRLILGNDEFPGFSERYSPVFAQFVQEAVSLPAQGRLQGKTGIVDRRVDHLAVPAAGLHAVAFVLFEEQHSPVVLGQGLGDGESDDARADDGDVKVKVLHKKDSSPFLLQDLRRRRV
jgi:hypothetical protein